MAAHTAKQNPMIGRNLSWLSHAEGHHTRSLSPLTHANVVDPIEEQLMFLCLFAYYGML